MLHVDFITGFIIILKILINRSLVKPIVIEKMHNKLHNVYFITVMSYYES